MKQQIFYVTSLMMVLLCGCSDTIQYEENIGKNTTRALCDNVGDFYYYKGGKIPLKINPDKVAVFYKSSGQMKKVNGNKELQIIDLKNTNRLSHKELINSLKEDENLSTVEYVVGDSIPVALSNFFYIKLKNTSDLALLQSEAEKIGCVVEKQVDSDPLWVRISNNKESLYSSSLQASNHLYETGLFADVDPGFVIDFKYNYTPTDTYYSSQWGVGKEGINLEWVWNANKGKPYITTAIVDGGVNTKHPDLVGVMHPYSYNCSNGTTNTTVSEHATFIAGIIAANHNSIGVAGVAPNTKLMNISCELVTRPTLSEELANGINKSWQNGADIINISFGDQGGAAYNQLHSALLESALNNALVKGRKGKGCVVSFAAGNHKVIDYPGYINDDILVVGAISQNGQVTDYSGRGSKLDVVAPGHRIMSTIINGYGYSDGTSYAAPYAAGLAALILSNDSTLTQRQVCDLMKASANKSQWNKDYGYGCIDANKASKIQSGDYFEILNKGNNNSFVSYGNTEYYIKNYSGNDIKWGHSEGIDMTPMSSCQSVLVNADFDGYSKDVELWADFMYKGYPIHVSHKFKLLQDPIIYGLDKIELYSTDERWNFIVNCADPKAEITVPGDGVIEFPYASDADFIDSWNRCFSIETNMFDTNKVYEVTICSRNKYTEDRQTFYITKDTDKIPTMSRVVKK